MVLESSVLEMKADHFVKFFNEAVNNQQAPENSFHHGYVTKHLDHIWSFPLIHMIYSGIENLALIDLSRQLFITWTKISFFDPNKI